MIGAPGSGSRQTPLLNRGVLGFVLVKIQGGSHFFLEKKMYDMRFYERDIHIQKNTTTVVCTCFKVGGVPVGLDRAAVSSCSWCNKKADVYGNFTKKLVSLEIGAQNRFALLLFCGRPSSKLNHFFRITPPSLTTEEAADIADAHLAAAVAAITHTPAAFYQTGHPLALRARLHAPITASSHTASDGGGAGFASLHTIAPGAFLASFIRR